MSPLGLYQPGTSVLHRLAAGWKLLALLIFATIIFALHSPTWLGTAGALVALGYPLTGIPGRRISQIVRTVLPLTVMLFLVQWWLLGLTSATAVCLRLADALMAANLFTLTTKIDDLVSAVERALGPLRRLGIRPESVGLLVGLTLQAISVLSAIASDTRDAQRARNAERSVSAFAVPFLVRTLRHSDELGEALAARGMGD